MKCEYDSPLCEICVFHEEFWDELNYEKYFDGCLCNHIDRQNHSKDTCPYFKEVKTFHCFLMYDNLCVLGDGQGKG